jgi:hypothetical protein
MAEVRQLLAEEVDIEERGGPRATTPLLAASVNGQAEVVMLLLEHGADASAKDNDGWTTMHAAAYWGLEAILLMLLEHGADSSAKDNAGWTPLHAAAYPGQGETARLLLEHGADLQSRTDDGLTPRQTPEDVATAQQRPQIVAMLQAEAERREAVRRARCEAFAMGHQERLGAGSRVGWLDAGVVRMVLEAGGFLPQEGSVGGEEGEEDDSDSEGEEGEEGDSDSEGEEDEEDEAW